jgi:hypothetical protein
MAPSAIDQLVPEMNEDSRAEDNDKTPLEAISHGDVMPGIPVPYQASPTLTSIH